MVNRFGVPGAAGQAIDNADPANASFDDILGREHGPAPNLGPYERDPLDDAVFADGFESPTP